MRPDVPSNDPNFKIHLERANKPSGLIELIDFPKDKFELEDNLLAELLDPGVNDSAEAFHAKHVENLQEFLKSYEQLVTDKSAPDKKTPPTDPKSDLLSKPKVSAKKLSAEKRRRIHSMYAVFNAFVAELSKELNMRHALNLKKFFLWQQACHPLPDLTEKQRDLERRWADSSGELPIESRLNLGHLKSLLHYMYIWSCEHIGTDRADRLFSNVADEVSRKPGACYFSPRTFM